ncbi:MAG TPA: Gldg family protein [Steroidobacteraceae bacterium]|nr:Gldg family protein [Steroidobacteraceae bacterium]
MAFDWRKTLQGHRGSGALTLVVLAVLFIGLIILSNYGLRGLRADLTENRLYTLSPGTRHIIEGLQEPINLYFYFSRETAGERAADIKTYGDRVREVLEEMAARSRGKIRLETIDPEPFSEDEDRAGEFGLRAIPTGTTGESFYFGLAGTNSTDGRAKIELFNPRQEEFLEYDIAKVIVELARPKKPVIGVLSTLPMGSDFNPMTGQASEPWAVTSQLEQLFTVRTLNADVASIDADVDVLLLVHPKALTPATLFAIDQFVLRGGRALIFVDPESEADTSGQQPGNPLAAMGANRSSSLEPLFKAWGVEFNPREVVGDQKHALMLGGRTGEPQRHLAFLGFDASNLDKKDVITASLDSVNFATAGRFKRAENSPLTFEPLVQSSELSGLIPVERLAMLMDPGTLLEGFQPTGERFLLAVRATGKLKTAYPDGKPAGEAGAAPITAPTLKESAQPVNLVLVADTDMLTDMMWVQRENFFGQRFAQAFANNGDMVLNAVDNLTGNSDLISIRGRATFVRPFDRVEALRRDAEERFRSKERELEEELRATEQKLTALQTSRNDQSSLILTPEQEQELERFQQQKAGIRKDLRDVRHGLDRDIKRLGTVVDVINIALVPLLITIFGLAVFVWRRRRARAAT